MQDYMNQFNINSMKNHFGGREAPPPQKILTVPSYNRLVIAGSFTSWGVGNGSLMVDMQRKGIPAGQR